MQLRYKSVVISMIIVAICIIALLLGMLRISKNTQPIVNLPETGSEKYTALIVQLIQDKDGTIKAAQMTATNGYAPALTGYLQENGAYRLKQLRSGKVLQNIKFDFQDHYIFENAATLSTVAEAKTGDPRVTYDTPTTYLTIKYYDNADLIITDAKGNTQLSIKSSAINEVISKKLQVTENVNAFDITNKKIVAESLQQVDGYFDVVYISSGYTDFNQFQSDANSMAQFMSGVEPFASYSDRIRYTKINNLADLGCYRVDRLYPCNLNQVFTVASAVNWDTIVVVINDNNYGGAGYTGMNVATTYRDVASLAKEVAVHEIGHSFASLHDEYSYGSATTQPVRGANCDATAGCPKWAGTPGTACYDVCSYTNWRRPTESHSLMRTLFPAEGYKFDEVARRHIEYILVTTYGVVINPSPTPTFTPTPTPTPLPAPGQFNVIFIPEESNVRLTWNSLTGATSYHIERCSGLQCTNFAEVTSTTNTQHTLPVPTGATHRYRVRAKNIIYGNYTNILDSNVSWVINAQAVCPDGNIVSNNVKLRHTLWPPQPLVWQTDSAAPGIHTVRISSNNSWSNGYVMLLNATNNTPLQLSGSSPHSLIVYGTYFNPPTPMAKLTRNATTTLPAGIYNIKYAALPGWCN